MLRHPIFILAFGLPLLTSVFLWGEDTPFPEIPKPRKLALPKERLTPGEFAKELARQSGLEYQLSRISEPIGGFDGQPRDFWPALLAVSQQTKSQWIINGNRLELQPSTSSVPNHVVGPFLIRPTGFRSYRDFLLGKTSHELTLEILWEPWLQVFRADSTVRDAKGRDDRQRQLTFSQQGARSPISGSSTTVRVYPQNLTREATRIAHLEGHLLLTLAEEMLTFSLDWERSGMLSEQKGVGVRLMKSKLDGKDWFVEFALSYPKNGPVWESHERYWTARNEARLIAPDGKVHKAEEGPEGDTSSSYTYLFRNIGKQVGPGWKLEYRTPGILREVRVPLELKEIDLP